ncbi:hypothetical protein ACFQL4_23200 [Halosimplex aquaticum]
MADSAAGRSGDLAGGVASSPAAREFRRQHAAELGRQRDRIVALVNETLTARPEVVESVRPVLVEALRSESVGVARAALAETLGRVAESDPEAVAETTDDLAGFSTTGTRRSPRAPPGRSASSRTPTASASPTRWTLTSTRSRSTSTPTPGPRASRARRCSRTSPNTVPTPWRR